MWLGCCGGMRGGIEGARLVLAVGLAVGLLVGMLHGELALASEPLSESVKAQLVRQIMNLVGGEAKGIATITIEETGPAEWPQMHYVKLWAEQTNGLRRPGLIYVSLDGAYLFWGNLIDANSSLSLTKARQGDVLPRYDVGRLNLAQAHRRGTSDAPLRLVEFSDFQCPFCTKLHPVMEQLLKEYPGKVVHYFKHAPLTHVHPLASRLHEAAECAGQQREEAFWVFHKRFFTTNTSDWDLGVIRKTTAVWAQEIQLDVAAFGACLDSESMAPVVARNLAESPMNATPTLIVGDEVVEGFWPYEQLRAIIERKLQALESESRVPDRAQLPAKSP